MINLLPFKQKEKIEKEKRLRNLLSLLFVLLVFLIFLSSIFYSLKIFALNFLEEDNSFTIEDELKRLKIEENEKEVHNFNVLAQQISSFYEKRFLTVDIFKKIYESLPAGAYVNNFETNRREDPGQKKEIVRVILRGYSPDWQSLLKMEEALKTNFHDVEFSAGTWTQLEDIDFLVTFEIK